jgi:hypothetical protein
MGAKDAEIHSSAYTDPKAWDVHLKQGSYENVFAGKAMLPFSC